MGSVRPPEPPTEPPSTGDVPRAVAEALDALARHRATIARHDSLRRTGREVHAWASADGAGPEPTAAEDAERDRNRHDGARMRDDVRRARQEAEAAHRALRRAVEGYARELRRQGVPPERMIVAVKGIVRRAAVSPDPLPDPEHLIPDLVQWSVAAYFAAD